MHIRIAWPLGHESTLLSLFWLFLLLLVGTSGSPLTCRSANIQAVEKGSVC